ncbi:MAG: hypothetical protein K2I90_10505 [Odoribacter sp.]|nr:hypothetical protein [Odoribacter sp.]
MFQDICVYVIVALAFGGLGCHIYRKLKALRRNKGELVCASCPLKKDCLGKAEERKKATGTCCHAPLY